MTGIEDWLRYVLGLLAVLGLILLAARGIRLLNDRGLPGSPRRYRRLAIEEFLPLDARRRLVLLRHDEQEYLVLLGHQGETLLNAGPRPAAESLPEAAEPKQRDLPATTRAGFGGIARALYHRLRSNRGQAVQAGDTPPQAARRPPAEPDALAANGPPRPAATCDDMRGKIPEEDPEERTAGGATPRTARSGRVRRPHGDRDNGV